MKFMKLGSKPDQFQTEEDNIRYVATDLATDMVIAVGDVKFYLHKFPLLSKSACLQKLVTRTNDDNIDEVEIHDIPGGPVAFEICAKFCYGMVVTLNAYNVVAARCAAEYLEMYETVEKGNLVYKVEVFLTSSIFRSWKDSIIVLQTTKSFHPWSEELKIVNQCVESIASKASFDTSKVDWSYTYNRQKLSSENGHDPHWNGVRKLQEVPKDWWVEDLCELQIDMFKRVIGAIRTRGTISGNVIGEALKAYIYKRLPGFSKGTIEGGDLVKYRHIVDTITWLLPAEKYSVSCSFLFKLLQLSNSLDCGEIGRRELVKKIGQQLEEATVTDLMIQGPPGVAAIYNVEVVQDLVEQFIAQEEDVIIDCSADNDFTETCLKSAISEASKTKVAHLVDFYLAEAARDPSLPVVKFVGLAEKVLGFPRPSHDGIYRAIDMYLKEHPEITKTEKKRICQLMDCRKLSVDACTHAVQNERLPLRVVVQVLFFEQLRSVPSSGGGSPSDLSGSLRTVLPSGPHGSSRSATTNTEDEWDSMPMAEEIKALKGDLATLRLKEGVEHANGSRARYGRTEAEQVAAGKMKGLAMSSKIFSKLWSSKDRRGENSSSETSDSPSSSNAEGNKSTPSRSRRQSLS